MKSQLQQQQQPHRVEPDMIMPNSTPDSPPLIQIAQYTIGGGGSSHSSGAILDVSDNPTSHHRYSVVMHDHDDAASFTTAMQQQQQQGLSTSQSELFSSFSAGDQQSQRLVDTVPIKLFEADPPKITKGKGKNKNKTKNKNKKTKGGGEEGKLSLAEKKKSIAASKQTNNKPRRGFFGRANKKNQANPGKDTKSHQKMLSTTYPPVDGLDDLCNSMEDIACGPDVVGDHGHRLLQQQQQQQNQYQRFLAAPQPTDEVTEFPSEINVHVDRDHVRHDGDKDVLDRVFEGVERWTCRPEESNTNPYTSLSSSSIVDVRSRNQKHSSKKTAKYSTTTTTVPRKQEHNVYSVVSNDVYNEQNGVDEDILDRACNGVENMTCRNDTTIESTTAHSSRLMRDDIDTKDAIDRLFEQFEGMACREPTTTEETMALAKELSTRSGNRSTHSPNSRPSSSTHQRSSVSSKLNSSNNNNNNDGDMIDSFFNNVEYVMCRQPHDNDGGHVVMSIESSQNANHHQSDVLDSICEPMDKACHDGMVESTNRRHFSTTLSSDLAPYQIRHADNSVIETVGTDIVIPSQEFPDVSMASCFGGKTNKKSTMTNPYDRPVSNGTNNNNKNDDESRDLLDVVFEGMESRLCRMEDEE